MVLGVGVPSLGCVPGLGVSVCAWSGGGGGVPGPQGGLVETPPRRLLLRAVRILLECILASV